MQSAACDSDAGRHQLPRRFIEGSCSSHWSGEKKKWASSCQGSFHASNRQ
jgi:hypothetical protein